MPRLVLLGDSIFDNQRYVPGEPDVVRQVQAVLPAGWTATLRAVDGATTASLPGQMGRLPEDASHLVVSMGGNDAIGASHILYAAVQRVADGVARLAEAQEIFAAGYEAALERVLAAELPTAICTIYDTPRTPGEPPVIQTALCLFNDVISRAAFGRGLPLIDLRLLLGEDADYANPIEPSAQGGRKMAAAIARLVESDWSLQVVA